MPAIDDSIAMFCAHLLTSGGRSRATIDGYSSDLEQFVQVTGVPSLEAISKNTVAQWLIRLRELELAPRSQARKLSALRTFVGWALDMGHITENPVPADFSPPVALYLPHTLSEEEVGSMLKCADGQSPEDLRDRAVLEVLYATGMRVSELCSLKLDDLQLGESFVIVTGKGSKQRLVPLGQYAVEFLQQYLDNARAAVCKNSPLHPEVFLSKRGPVSRSTVFRIVKKYAGMAGVSSRVSPHTMRHSCASHLLARGADLRLVQELLGHASLTTTQVYTHIEKTHMRRIYDKTHPLAKPVDS